LEGDGKIRYTEFLAATIEAQGAISEARLAEAFDRMDSDDCGFISAKNISEMLGNEFPKEAIEAIIKEAETDNDGKISYAEFLALWEDRKEEERDEVLKEIIVLKGRIDTGSERSLTLSTISGDESDFDQKSNHIVSRANFIDGKKFSERKIPGGGKKRVMFSDSVETVQR
jgi:hypothetical protein